MAHQERIYRVFISSTYNDLKTERSRIIEALLGDSNLPVGMEWFTAGDEDQWKVITDYIDICDYYVILVGHRYGSTTADGISFTEKEYDYAVSRPDLPVLRFLKKDDALIPADSLDQVPGNAEKIKAFREKVRSCGKNVEWWGEPYELEANFLRAFRNITRAHPKMGLRPAESAAPETLVELARLSAENAQLKQKLEGVSANDRQVALDITRLFAGQTLKVLHVRSDGSQDEVSVCMLDVFFWLSSALLVGCTRAEAALILEQKLSWLGGFYVARPQTELQAGETLAMFLTLFVIDVTSHDEIAAGREARYFLTQVGRLVMHWQPAWAAGPDSLIRTLDSIDHMQKTKEQNPPVETGDSTE